MSTAASGSAGAYFQLLGPVRLFDGERAVPIGGPGVRGLLALLALSPNRVVGLDDIIDALWSEDPPATARTIVHGNVSHLRRVLRSISGGGPGHAQILTAPPGYQLSVDPQRIDVNRARTLLDRANAAPSPRRADLLRQAFSLWQGPSLSGVPESLRAPELEELRLAVHGARVDADLAEGGHSALIVELSPLVRANPLAERTVGQLMRALYYAGRRSDALELYQRVSRQVVDALGMDPGPELRHLQLRVLNDDLPPLVPADAVVLSASVAPAQLPPAVPHLAGREADLAWLDELLERAEAGQSAVGVVTGPAGIGKSALVVSWAHRAANRFPDGVLFASLRGFDPHHPAFEPADLITQFLLGLGVPTADVPEQLHERVALYRSLIAGRRMLVLLDDARTAEQARPLLPPGSRSMALVTSRSRLDGLAVSNAARLRALDTLSPEDSVRLIEELTGPADRDLNHALAKLCGYLPLALRIAGARLAASPQWTAGELVDELTNERTRLAALDVGDAGGPGGADTSVRAALDVSFRGLPPDVATTFRTLGALTSRSVGPQLIAALSGTTVREARRRLRTLVTHNLLAETVRDVFTQHDLVRLYLRELAETELTDAEREAALSSSMRYYLAVADQARRKLLRIVDPLDFAGSLPAELSPDLDGFDGARRWFAAEWPNLLATLEAALAARRYTEVWQLARVAHTYQVVCPLWDDWTRLVEIGMAAATGSGDDLARCWMLISRCALALTFELPEGSLADASEALEIAKELDDDRLIISATIHLGGALTLWGRYDEAIVQLRDAVEETDRMGDLALRGQALNNCAEAEKRAGRRFEAIMHQLASLEIDRQLGDDSYVVVSLNNLAELNLGLGELSSAERYARESVHITVTRQFTLQEGVSRLTLARTLLAKGDPEGAREQFELALRLYELANPKFADEVRAELRELGSRTP
jgi:DNA-binding SARP family transcriptional activator/tetratricopeptide (TPR) repeat protein